MPAMAVEINMGGTSFVVAGADEGIWLYVISFKEMQHKPRVLGSHQVYRAKSCGLWLNAHPMA